MDVTRPPSHTPVSIIACVKDGGQYADSFRRNLLTTLDSSYELILIDDGSTDDTWECFLQFAAVHKNTRLIRHDSPHGLGASQEEGVRRASGEYLWLVDCDDEWDSSIVQKLLQAAERDQSDVVVCRAELRDDAAGRSKTIDGIEKDLCISGVDASKMMLRGEINGYTWNKLYRRKLFAGEAPPLLTTQPDFCRTALAISKSASVSTVSESLYTYIRRGSSISDSSEPNLDNLRVSLEYMKDLSTVRLGADSEYTELIRYFEAWFYAIAVAKIPVLVGASYQTQAAGGRLAKTSLSAVPVQTLVSRSPRVAAEALLLKVSPLLYRNSLKLFSFLKRSRRRLKKDPIIPATSHRAVI